MASFPATTEKERHHRKQTSDHMKTIAEHRRCPKCKRGFALSRTVGPDGFRLVHCRWKDCGYETGGYVGEYK